MDKLAREDHTVVISCELGLKCVMELVLWRITEADVVLPNLAWTISSRGYGRNLAWSRCIPRSGERTLISRTQSAYAKARRLRFVKIAAGHGGMGVSEFWAYSRAFATAFIGRLLLILDMH